MQDEFLLTLFEFVMKVVMFLIDLVEWLHARKGKGRPPADKGERPN